MQVFGELGAQGDLERELFDRDLPAARHQLPIDANHAVVLDADGALTSQAG